MPQEAPILAPESAGQGGGTFGLRVDMIVLACGRCGVYFAMPRTMHMAAVGERRPVYCPAGHSTIEGTANAVETAFELAGRLADAETRLTVALAGQGRSDVGGGQLLPDAAELVRRARFMAARAVEGAHRNGRYVCRVCGQEKRGHEEIASHLLRAHVAELIESTVE